jgi:hypothetical protein
MRERAPNMDWWYHEHNAQDDVAENSMMGVLNEKERLGSINHGLDRIRARVRLRPSDS